MGNRFFQRPPSVPASKGVSHQSRPTACFIPAQANGLLHTSPGQRPGITASHFTSQANGLPHTVHNKTRGVGLKWFSNGGRFLNQMYKSRFQRFEFVFDDMKPRALPWAGIKRRLWRQSATACFIPQAKGLFHTAGQRPVSYPRPTACFIPAQGNALGSPHHVLHRRPTACLIR